MSTSRRGALPLPALALAAFLTNMSTPAFGFRVAPAAGVGARGAPILNNLPGHHVEQQPSRSPSAATTLLLSSSEEFPNTNSQEQEMMDQALMEQEYLMAAQEAEQEDPPAYDLPNRNTQEQEMMEQALREQEFRKVAQESGQTIPSQNRMDPLIASLTRIDDPTPADVPMRNVPLFGEVPADGNLALLVPAAAIGILGFLFSIVVAFNSRDALVQELSKVEVPEMKYTETVVKEGQCRGLCSSQDDDLDGLRNFMESLSKKN